ncbi:hypothetical protein G7075_14700 [Phycicoccus sp. HDW14]|uniref:hypothetical protein n=1 Tax=Phycicoccus sp. HDW14 TaxID=2714941 RepID=UPI00140ADF90|nr:hypothetical protein [Phycicoccus sp. HDW14]QIM22091.1 hypothetical protein G7075_14700 [Phycicoccus sp. HDW14]
MTAAPAAPGTGAAGLPAHAARSASSRIWRASARVIGRRPASSDASTSGSTSSARASSERWSSRVTSTVSR